MVVDPDSVRKVLEEILVSDVFAFLLRSAVLANALSIQEFAPHEPAVAHRRLVYR